MTTAREWIDRLKLSRHPEGGFFRETYRSAEILAKECLPDRFTGPRCFSTAIYFLLTSDDFSALHRIRQDEVWHFYDGACLTIHIIRSSGEYARIKLGRDGQNGTVPQAVVPAGELFGATVDERDSFSLVGCTVAPGFDFADFALPSRGALIEQHPEHRQIIRRLTR
jgi:predicted cupin superfamily sugar epimerase